MYVAALDPWIQRHSQVSEMSIFHPENVGREGAGVKSRNYRFKEHSLYWTSDQAKNNGRAVASFLLKGH